MVVILLSSFLLVLFFFSTLVSPWLFFPPFSSFKLLLSYFYFFSSHTNTPFLAAHDPSYAGGFASSGTWRRQDEDGTGQTVLVNTQQ
ncbi:hypothetical protein GGI35DRAFT_451138 [Trichoderma velutinum]